MKRFKMAPELHYEDGALNYLYDIDFKSAFVVTDQIMEQLGLTNKVIKILEDKKVPFEKFAEVEPNPSVKTISKALEIFLKTDADILIAIGGGSVLDAAKAIIYFLQEAIKNSDLKREKPFFVVIPTTSGTGSEVTSYSVLTDTDTGMKIPLKDDGMFPDIAILDCEFTKTVPPSVTADTGMDVLTHAIEAYVSNIASDCTTALAQMSIEFVFKYLPNCYKNGLDSHSRGKIHNASCMAGMAFENASLGINHSLAHVFGAKFHVSHGKANAVLLPYVIQYNSGLFDHNDNVPFDTALQYQKIAKLIGLPSSNMKEAVIMLTKSIKLLNMKLQIPISIREMGIDETAYMVLVDEMAETAMKDICTAGNPRVPHVEDLKKILINAFNGISNR